LGASLPNAARALYPWFRGGGSGDFAARLIAQLLSDRQGQQFIVENRTGAGGNIAVEAVARAPADGYTLLQLNVANAINTALYEKLNFNLLNDIVPVASFMRVPDVMEVSLSLPVKTVPEFIAYAKANPGKIAFASSGVGSSIHMSGELFKAMAKIDMLHVPYRGIAAGGLSDLITGVVHVAFDNLPSSIELIRSGKVRALAVTTTARSELLPDVPTVGDFLPGYEASAWYGVGAPSGTPAEIVQKLNKELNAAFVDPRTKARIAEVGGTPLPGYLRARARVNVNLELSRSGNGVRNGFRRPDLSDRRNAEAEPVPFPNLAVRQFRYGRTAC
jgi:tripartite-type tricarboxylate transporter receptor subunit TctC